LQFAHEPSGRIVRVEVGRESATLAWDAAGKLLSVTEGSGKATTAAYDSSNRPTEIVSSTGQTWRFRYKQDLLVEAYGPEGSCHVLPGRQTLTLATSRSDGAWDIRVLDRGLHVLRYQSQGARPVQFLRDSTGNLSSIRNECGEVRYGVDESALTADIVFGNK
jgi:YD repeat-containing protein